MSETDPYWYEKVLNVRYSEGGLITVGALTGRVFILEGDLIAIFPFGSKEGAKKAIKNKQWQE